MDDNESGSRGNQGGDYTARDVRRDVEGVEEALARGENPNRARTFDSNRLPISAVPVEHSARIEANTDELNMMAAIEAKRAEADKWL